MSSGDKKYFANPAKHFAVASSAVDPRIVELVRHLARVAADNDYKTLTEADKLRNDGPRKKGPKND